MREADIASRYAKALFFRETSLDAQKKQLDTLEAFLQSLQQHRELALFFGSPQISLEQKEKAIEGALTKSSPDLIPFFALLIRNGRMGSLSLITEQYRALLDEKAGVLPALFRHAGSFDRAVVDDMTKKLEALFNKKLSWAEEVDPKLIGGGVIEAKGRRLDFSTKTMMDQMRNQLIGEASFTFSASFSGEGGKSLAEKTASQVNKPTKETK